jgi:hypothetical protein
MQETSSLYKRLLADPGHWKEYSLAIGESGVLVNEQAERITFGGTNILVASSGAEGGFRESSIISMSTQKSIFSDSNPSVGNCIAGQITVDMMKPKGDIPRRARLAPYVRLTNGIEYSEWIQKGVFFIDHREYSGDENERMAIYGYDHIILAEEEFPSSTHTWPRKDIDVVRDIASEIGTTLDSRTVKIINKGYFINYPVGYSMREVLENIAAMYAGSFVMSDSGELLLVTMFGIPKETSFLIDNVGFYITFGGDRILV